MRLQQSFIEVTQLLHTVQLKIAVTLAGKTIILQASQDDSVLSSEFIRLRPVGQAGMPISSGANRWPKSYWTKPQPRESQLRMITVAERPSVRRSVHRTVSVTSSVDSPSKLGNGFHSETSPTTTYDGVAASDAELERPVLRSPGVVVPPSVEKVMTVREDEDDEGRRGQQQHTAELPRHVESYPATVAETSFSNRPSVSPQKRTGRTRSVSVQFITPYQSLSL